MTSTDINHAIRIATGIDREDFDSDLNAMHEAENHLSPEQWLSYMPCLHEIVGRAVNLCIHSTARQRAEAFLRTIGKWKDA